MQALKFGNGNSKLDQAIFTFSLPAGWTCPFAKECESRTNPKTGKIEDGPQTIFRCFAATDELVKKSVREARWHNFNLLKPLSRKGMGRLILDSLSPFAGIVRIHVSGDFFSQKYLDTWLEVARKRDRTLFYFYTKALPFWIRRMNDIGDGFTEGEIPNIVPTASYGGKFDHLIAEYGLRYSQVVFSEMEAADLGLEIDHDDSHAMAYGPPFALLVHGQQPAKSFAGKATHKMRANGIFGYGKYHQRKALTVL